MVHPNLIIIIYHQMLRSQTSSSRRFVVIKGAKRGITLLLFRLDRLIKLAFADNFIFQDRLSFIQYELYQIVHTVFTAQFISLYTIIAFSIGFVMKHPLLERHEKKR